MDFIKINGVTLHYRFLFNTALGDRGKTFLFINSLGTDFRIWNDVVEILKAHGNILLYDKRGHGLTDVVINVKGLEDYMEDAIALLEYLSIKKCIIIGLSVGGMIAQLLAYHHPEKVEKIILCDTRHKIGNAQGWNERIDAVKEYGLQSISESVMQRWFSEGFHINNGNQIVGYKNMMERTPIAGYIQACEAIRDADLTAIAKEIKVVCLCIAGSEDKSTTPEEVKDLACLIEGSRYEVIQSAGHIPCVDNAGVLSNLIIDFIKE